MAALDMNALKQYVQGGRRAVPIGTLLLDITHNLLQSRFVEISFSVTDTVNDIKARVYGMTGSSEQHMRLLLNGRIEMRAEDNKLLGEYGAQSGDFIHVIDEDPFSTARGGAMDDVTQVKKFELTEEEYDKRDGTYRAYKRKMLAQDPNWKSIYQINSEKRAAALREQRRAKGYPDEKYEEPASIRERIQVGMRCIVEPGDRRGEVKYVGPVPELTNYEVALDGACEADIAAANAKLAAESGATAPAADAGADASAAAADPVASAPATAENLRLAGIASVPLTGECLWIGVQLDEPVGKHDGIIKGKRYFQAHNHAGVFAKPSAVRTGDFPEVDPFASDEEEDDKPPALEPTGGAADKFEEL